MQILKTRTEQREFIHHMVPLNHLTKLDLKTNAVTHVCIYLETLHKLKLMYTQSVSSEPQVQRHGWLLITS